MKNEKEIQIVIIDTGANIERKSIKSCTVIKGLTLYENSNGSLKVIDDKFTDKIGHGTDVLSIINSHNEDVLYIIIKLDSYNGIISEPLLSKGLEYVLNNVKDADIINISMGIQTYSPSIELKDICDKLNEKGILIVAAAYSDSSRPCYPAYFDMVFGVGSAFFESNKSYTYLPQKKINILSKGNDIYIDNNLLEGTSYATANFTGLLSTILLRTRSRARESLLSEIYRNSISPIYNCEFRYSNCDEILSKQNGFKAVEFINKNYITTHIKEIALFPINSCEFERLLRNRLVLEYEITIGFDFSKNNAEIEGIEVITEFPLTDDKLNLFDTIIIGNITDGFGLNILKLSLIKQFLNAGKTICTWDIAMFKIIEQLIEKEIPEFAGKVLFINFERNFLKVHDINLSLPMENIPTIGIIGIDNCCSVLAQQIQLNKILSKEKYKVANITTQPEAFLYRNTDIVFPFKIKSIVSIDWKEWNIFFALAKRFICYQNNPDIFFCGLDDFFLGIDCSGNLDDRDSFLMNINFLTSVQIDSYILVVGRNTNKRKIKKMISFFKYSFNLEPIMIINDNIEKNKHGNNSNLKTKYAIVNLNDEKAKKIVTKLIYTKFSN